MGCQNKIEQMQQAHDKEIDQMQQAMRRRV